MSSTYERHRPIFSRLCSKTWNQKFVENKWPLGPVSWLREVHLSENGTYREHPIRLFMEDYEGVPDPKVEQVVSFAKGASLSDLVNPAQGGSGQERQARAWLDDTKDEGPDGEGSEPRSSETPTTRVCRRYEGYLTAPKLWRHLSAPRYEHGDLPHAHRRLIYVPDLDDSYILALAETAPDHMVDTLRDAFWNHIERQTSLKARISRKGFPTFCLEFHVPYRAWRPGKIETRHHRKWTNLSHWTDSSMAGIYEAHITIIVIGTGERRWTALCFGDTYYDPDAEPGTDEFSYDVDAIMADKIIADAEYDANKPIWNPREYFAIAVKNRMEQVFHEWGLLVRQVKAGIRRLKETRPSLSDQPGFCGHLDESTMEALEQMKRLVDDLSEELSKTCGAWRRFAADDGDVQYFFDPAPEAIDDTVANTLRDIKGIFENLQELQEDLLSLSRECQSYNHLLQLTKESNRSARQNGTATQITVLFISPVLVVSAVFAIDNNVMAFRRDPTSFVLSILAAALGIQFLSLLLNMVQDQVPWRHCWRKLQACGREWIFKRVGMNATVGGYGGIGFSRKRPRRSGTVDTMRTLVADANAIPLQAIVTG